MKNIFHLLRGVRAIILLIALSTILIDTCSVKETIGWFSLSIILSIEIIYIKLNNKL